MDFYINRKKNSAGLSDPRTSWNIQNHKKGYNWNIVLRNINILSLLSASLSLRSRLVLVFQYDIWQKQAVSRENIKLDVSSVHWPNGGPTLFSQHQPYNPQPNWMLAKQSHAVWDIISKYSLFECLLTYALYKSAYFSYPSNNQNLQFL